MSKKPPLEKARADAFLLLKFRPRSKRELVCRLKKKKFSGAVIRETLAFLKERGFLNDDLFAKVWIEERLRKPLSLRMIGRELALKGVNKGIIEKSLRQAEEGYCEADAVKKLAAWKLSRIEEADSPKARRRLYQYLLRRGFSPEIIEDVLS